MGRALSPVMARRSEKRQMELVITDPARRLKGSQCNRCFYLFAGQSACAAFPSGIPGAILSGRLDHSQPYPGDGGIRFLAREEIENILDEVER